MAVVLTLIGVVVVVVSLTAIRKKWSRDQRSMMEQHAIAPTNSIPC
jgi:hypothetical protein